MKVNKKLYLDVMERQLGLWGGDGQDKIRRAHVAVGGLGGIGAVSALMLAKAGIGRLTVCDRDIYEVENIVEQAFATYDSVGKPKAEVAAKEMGRHSSGSQLTAFIADLSDRREAARLVAEADILVSGVDNPWARLALAQACRNRGIPMIVSANIGWSVMHTMYMPQGPEYADSWQNIPGVHWKNGGPDISDSQTIAAIEKDWKIWAAALSGFMLESLQKLLMENQTYYWYAAPQAYFIASMGVLDALKYLVNKGHVTKFPEVFYYDMHSNRQLMWNELQERRVELYEAWDRGPEAVVACVRRWQNAS